LKIESGLFRSMGPEGNEFMPSTVEFVSDLFGDKHGAYRYLSELLVPDKVEATLMQPHSVAGSTSRYPVVFS